MSICERTEMLLGRGAVEKLKASRVAVFGAGGVGGFTIEALARSGIGKITVIDADEVSLSNVNRQVFATLRTVGKRKVDAARERIAEVSQGCEVETRCEFFTQNSDFPFENYDYIVDAIDTVSAKIYIAKRCFDAKIPVISAMGAGNKLDPTKFTVTDIFRTSVCPLAAVMRRELRKRGVEHLKVVYSTEPALTPMFQPDEDKDDATHKKITPASWMVCPAVCGLIIAGEVIRDICGIGLDGGGRG